MAEENWATLKQIGGVQLSVGQRQSLRDNFHKYSEAVNKIKELTGLPRVWLEEADFKAVMGDMNPDNIGQYRSETMSNIARSLESMFADDMVKEAVLEAWTSGRIVVAKKPSSEDGGRDKWKTAMRNGDYLCWYKIYPYCQYPWDDFVVDTRDITPSAAAAAAHEEKKGGTGGGASADDWTTLRQIGGVQLTVGQRQSLRDNFQRYSEAVDKIKELTGLPRVWLEEADFKAVMGDINPDNIGQYRSEAMSKIARSLESMFEDELIKQAVLEAWTSGRIVVAKMPSSESGGRQQWKTAMRNGDYMCWYKIYPYCQYPWDDFVVDTHDIAPSAAAAAHEEKKGGGGGGASADDWTTLRQIGGVQLTVGQRQSLRDNFQKYSEAVDKIKELTGLPRVCLEEADFKAVMGDINPDNIGQYRSEAMSKIARSLESMFADELIKQAVLEAWTSGRIVVAKRPGSESGGREQWKTAMRNGDYLCWYKIYPYCQYPWDDFVVDLHDIVCTGGPADEENAAGPDADWGTLKQIGGVQLTVAQRKNLRDNYEKYREAIQQIKDLLSLQTVYVEEEDMKVHLERLERTNGQDCLGSVRATVAQNMFKALERACEDDIMRESILEAWTTGRILIGTRRPDDGYRVFGTFKSFIQDGDLAARYNITPWCQYQWDELVLDPHNIHTASADGGGAHPAKKGAPAKKGSSGGPAKKGAAPAKKGATRADEKHEEKRKTAATTTADGSEDWRTLREVDGVELSVAQRQDLRQHWDRYREAIGQIQELLSIPSVRVVEEDVSAMLEAMRNVGGEDHIGEVRADVACKVYQALESACSDDILKESIQECWTSGRIVIGKRLPNDGIRLYSNMKTFINGGDLFVRYNVEPWVQYEWDELAIDPHRIQTANRAAAAKKGGGQASVMAKKGGPAVQKRSPPAKKGGQPQRSEEKKKASADGDDGDWGQLKEIDGVKLSLAQRKDFRDSYARYNEVMGQIQELVSMPKVRVEEEDFKAHVDALGDQSKTPGQLRCDIADAVYMQLLLAWLDELVKEAIRENWTSGRIVIARARSDVSGAPITRILDGNLYVFWADTPACAAGLADGLQEGL